MTDETTPDEPSTLPAQVLPAAALRALAEAEARRAAPVTPMAKELGGRNGPEPVRFGDWEKKGIAIDF
ncbi:MAG: DUF1674 domain-containing protein [Microgenomates group bacterium]